MTTPIKIAIIHPEGNFTNNPNLYEIAAVLCEQGYMVDLFMPFRWEVNQRIDIPALTTFINPNMPIPTVDGFCCLKLPELNSRHSIERYLDRNYSGYDFIIGVDRGIIEAAIIGNHLNIPFGMISYEIFFDDEAGAGFNDSIRTACRNVSFAVVQDNVRGDLLSSEYSIPRERLIYIPVSSSGIVKAEKSRLLHNRLNIPEDKKIALFAGSVSDWTMIDYFLENASRWDNNWVAVVHNRYGMHGKMPEYIEKYKASRSIYFSLEPVDSPNEMTEIISAADIGVAFYRTIPGDIFLGKNIANIGFASGKISTYLKHGLPILVNRISLFGDLTSRYHLGQVVDGNSQFSVTLSEAQLAESRINCEQFFMTHLNLDRFIDSLLSRLQEALGPGGSKSNPIDWSAVIGRTNLYSENSRLVCHPRFPQSHQFRTISVQTQTGK